jgi:hypothetical protein
MDDVMSDELYNKFMKIVEGGDEARAREFLVENLKQFPEKTQNAIIMAFFEEALSANKENADAVSNFQKQGLRMIDELEKVKAKLQDKAKLIEMKKKI